MTHRDRVTLIKVRNEIEMVHLFAKADPTSPTYFLKYPHRHVFKVTSKVQVFHEDREIEFFALKQRVQEELAKFKYARNDTDFSCETLADYLLEFIEEVFGSSRMIEIEVSEDGENSAIVGNYFHNNSK